MKRLVLLALPLALSACSSAQLANGVATASKYQQDVANACAVASVAANDPASVLLAANVAPVAQAINLVRGSCGTEEALAKIALDPLTVAWVGTLTTTIQSGGKVVPPAPVAPGAVAGVK